VHDAVTDIRAGHLEKVVLARSLGATLASGRVSVAATARALAEAHPHATVYAVALPGGEALCGATPEVLARVSGGVLHTQAVAGTGAPDRLLHSDKDRHEHQVVVDDITATLAQAGIDAGAASSPRVERYGELAHLVTPIEAQLPPGMGVLDVVALLHPTAALCGAPRHRARAWLRKHEPIERGWYGGPLGWADSRGDGAFVVALRCARFSADRRTVTCYGGAGIVAASRPEDERAETAAKMRAVKEALRLEVEP
ncbi:MAG TPA: isochorismate synthase, partial [Gemmatimonadales bacterium]|nr:isochorismate synthase [Gemmatimonadales bacterium]